MLVIKLSGVAVFIAAVCVGLGVLLTRPVLYYAAIALSLAAFLTIVASAFPWRRRPRRYP